MVYGLTGLPVYLYGGGMSDATKVVVYVPAEESRVLRAEGEDVAAWVRELVRAVLAKRKESRVAV